MPNSMANIDILYQNQVKNQSAFAQCRTALNSTRQQNRTNSRKVRLLMFGPTLVIGTVAALTGKNHVS